MIEKFKEFINKPEVKEAFETGAYVTTGGILGVIANRIFGKKGLAYDTGSFVLGALGGYGAKQMNTPGAIKASGSTSYKSKVDKLLERLKELLQSGVPSSSPEIRSIYDELRKLGYRPGIEHTASGLHKTATDSTTQAENKLNTARKLRFGADSVGALTGMGIGYKAAPFLDWLPNKWQNMRAEVLEGKVTLSPQRIKDQKFNLNSPVAMLKQTATKDIKNLYKYIKNSTPPKVTGRARFNPKNWGNNAARSRAAMDIKALRAELARRTAQIAGARGKQLETLTNNFNFPKNALSFRDLTNIHKHRNFFKLPTFSYPTNNIKSMGPKIAKRIGSTLAGGIAGTFIADMIANQFLDIAGKKSHLQQLTEENEAFNKAALNQ